MNVRSLFIWPCSRAQWRAAASVPRSVDQSREILERTFSEHRRHIIGLVKGFEEATEAKLQLLRNLRPCKRGGRRVHRNIALATGRSQSRGQIDGRRLADGCGEWHRAHQQFETERRTRRCPAAMTNTGTFSNWFSQDCCYWPRAVSAFDRSFCLALASPFRHRRNPPEPAHAPRHQRTLPPGRSLCSARVRSGF